MSSEDDQDKMVKRTVSLKLDLDKSQKEQLDNLFDVYGQAVISTFNKIKRIYDSFQIIDNPKIGVCGKCGEADQELKWKHELTKSFYCNKCYYMAWSMQTLTKADGYQAELISNFPELSPAHKGYYAGVTKYSVPSFKSYLSKLKDRNKEIILLKQQIIAETNIVRQKKLEKKLIRKEKGLKPFEFSKNIIYFGNPGMFEFKKNEAGYWLGITSPSEKRTKIWFKLSLGEREDYKTEHNKYKIIDDCIAKKEHKQLFGKLLRRENYVEFMFPKRDLSESLLTNSEISKFFRENKETPVFCLSFGVRNPINMAVLKAGKLLEVKHFGDGSFFHSINRNRELRAKVCRKLANKHKGKWGRNKARTKYFNKRFMNERNFIKYHTHFLTTEVVRYVKEKYGGGIFVFRDTTGIKRINYPPIYRVVLDRWNIELQKTMLEYKEKLKDFHIYKLAYKNSNNLKCSRCNKEIVKDGKPVKVLTVKLRHGFNKKAILSHKMDMLQKKFFRLQKYPQTKENLMYTQEVGKELKKTKDLLDKENNEKDFKIVQCSCGNKQDFYLNDELQLYSSFLHGAEAEQEHAS